MKEKWQIWTIGHSNRSIDTFLELLGEHGIQVLVDVRSFPTSKIEHFKREELAIEPCEKAFFIFADIECLIILESEGKFLV